MRTIDEIKADIELCQKCIREKNADFCLYNCRNCNYIPWVNLRDLETELIKAITHDIPADELEALCQAWREGKMTVLKKALELACEEVGKGSCKKCDQNCQFCALTNPDYFIEAAEVALKELAP